MNMYRYDGTFKYACQMCHDSCSNIEIAQLFNNPETELDPMNLCLCPNCAQRYRKLRNDTAEMEYFMERILDMTEDSVSREEYVAFNIGDSEIWFTQVHFAEIQSLMKLEKDVKNNDNEEIAVAEDETDGLSVFSEFEGKKLQRKKDGFLGEILKVEDGYVLVKVLNGEKAGTETRFQLSFIVGNPEIYQII